MTSHSPIRTSVLSLSRRQTVLALLFPILACAAYYAPRWLGHIYPPLPSYLLSVTGGLSDSCCGEQDVRSPVQARLDSPLDIVLRPERAPRGPVFVQAFKLLDGEPTRLALWMQTRSDGTLHLRGLAGDVLDLEPGTAGPIELVFTLSRSPVLRSYETLCREASGQPGAAVQLHRSTITIEPAPAAT